METDINEGRKPLILIGVVGSPILGQNDMISRIIGLKKSKARFWIHIVGQVMNILF